MATDNQNIRDGSCVVASDLSGQQFYAVKMSTSTDRTVVLASSGGERIRGILQNKPKAGYAADIVTFGRSKAIIGATVTVGQDLMTDASGKLIPATGTNHRVATAIDGGATNNIVSVDVQPIGTVA